jgi:predicted amidohydrolase YtcJ
MKNRILWIACILWLIVSCMKGEKVDFILHNARILTMDEKFSEGEAMAIKDGNVVEVGPERQILNKYRSNESIDCMGKMILPGFIDAHAHMMTYARAKLSVNLFGVKTEEQLLIRCEKYAQKSNFRFIYGRGWDQTLWGSDSFPSNDKLNKLFPSIPVVLYRVDGHAVLANSTALKMAGITIKTNVEGGLIEVKGGKMTGILLDNAIQKLTERMPDFPAYQLEKQVLEIQEELIQFGLTEVHEAGVDEKDRDFLLKMNEKNKLKINVYCMLFPTTKNRIWAQKNGKFQKNRLTISSFKVIADGALGSRGAFLKKNYHDHADHRGFLTESVSEMNKIADFAKFIDYQVNFHAIGDSTGSIVLNIIKNYCSDKPDHRWRIEHAQVLDPKDWPMLQKYNVIPSVQPVHATSDQFWAEKRVGKSRMKGAYAYKSLMDQAGFICFGTDFPIELPNPFLTIHAATQRKNAQGLPLNGFKTQEAIDLNNCLKAMTFWSAMASFREDKVGSLEKGKLANFTVLLYPLKSEGDFEENFSWKTFMEGTCIFSAE